MLKDNMTGPQKTESVQSQNAPDPNAANAKSPGNGAPPAAAPLGLKGKSKWAKLAGNGTVKRSGSLAVPGDGDAGSERSGSANSDRRESKLSLGSQISGLDLSKIQVSI